MSDMNKWTGIGRLARDAELKYLNNGTAVLNFSIAVGKSIPPKDGGDGQWDTKTSFFDCLAWGQMGERKAKMLTKGRQVGIEGELQQDRWEKDGQQHSRVKINCSSIQILALPKGQQEKVLQAPAEGAQSGKAADDHFEDDIPFRQRRVNRAEDMLQMRHDEGRRGFLSPFTNGGRASRQM